MTPAGDFDAVATVSDSTTGTTISSELGDTLTAETDNSMTLAVDMEVSSTEALPAGEYTYDVMLTAKPN